MYPYFDTADLSVETLLQQWRWLYPQRVQLVAVNAFGDLFLQESQGAVLRLDTSSGLLERISDSLEGFKELVGNSENREKWFLVDVEQSLIERGFCPLKGKCLGYKIPIVFSESTGTAENVYVADLYEYVSLLGDLHSQMRDLPDGQKVRLGIGKPERAK